MMYYHHKGKKTLTFLDVFALLWFPWHTPVSCGETVADSVFLSAKSESQTVPTWKPPDNPKTLKSMPAQRRNKIFNITACLSLKSTVPNPQSY